MLKWAADWNEWTDDDLLLKLAGHLKERALQEGNLLPDSDREPYESAVTALRGRLDPGSPIMATHDFRHAPQEESEKRSDFITCIGHLFKFTYGRDPLSVGSQSTLLNSYGRS